MKRTITKTIAALMCALAVTTLVSSCRTSFPVSRSGGNDPAAALLITGDGHLKGSTVDVTVGNSAPIKIKVAGKRNALTEKPSCAIDPGSHRLVVTSGNDTLYDKTIFVSQGETKTIALP